jgi:O-antigen ligase
MSAVLKHTSVFKKVQQVLLCCVAFTMPFTFEDLKFNSYFIILTVLNSILLFFFEREKVKPVLSKLLLLFVSVYFFHLLGLLFADNSKEATFELQKKLSLFLFPMIFFYSPKFSSGEIKAILLCFVGSCALTILSCFLVADFHFIKTGDNSLFFYHNLSGIAGMHAVYLSMYLCFAVAILLFVFMDALPSFTPWKKLLYCSSLSLLVAGIVLLSSRMSMIILVAGAILFIIFRFKEKIGLLRSFLGAAALGLLMISLVLISPKNRDRIRDAIKGNTETLDKNWGWGGWASRGLMWDCAVQLIEAHPLTGVGTGDVQDALQQCYTDNKYVILTYYQDKIKYNAHNQFLQTAIGLGVPGLGILLLSMAGGLMHAVRRKKILYFVFIILFLVSCFTESMLERQSGVVFYSFFNSIFAFWKLPESEDLQ